MMRDPLRRHQGRQVVAHLADADLAGRLERVTRDAIVLTSARMLVGSRGDVKTTPLDGEQHVSRAGLWLQVEP